MDWINAYMDFTEGMPSPEIFRLWAAIGAVAAALERRVWVETAEGEVYPHLYTLLVANPGIGKSIAIGPVERLWYDTQKLHVAPHSVTKAALVDALATANTKRLMGQELVEYHSLAVPAGEFGVLVPAHDLEFMSVINSIYDAGPVYREQRRTLNRNIEIIRPQMNILAGAQPGYLASVLPEEAWSMGFTSRLIMVYSGFPVKVPLFGVRREEKRQQRQALLGMLKRLGDFYGPMLWEPAAAVEMERWAAEGLPPVPEHSKLQHYCSRRIVHILKLCIIATASAGRLVVELSDLDRARGWLLAAEETMPDIFKAMVRRSDSEVLQEMHHYVWGHWIKTKKPMGEKMLLAYMSERATTDKIPRIIDIAVRSGMLDESQPLPGIKVYTPRARHLHGME